MLLKIPSKTKILRNKFNENIYTENYKTTERKITDLDKCRGMVIDQRTQ